MYTDAYPIDREFAYRRSLELLDLLDTESREKLGSKRYALPGPWRRPREIIEAGLRSVLFDCVLRDKALDDTILALIEPMANFSVRINEPPSRPLRPPAFSLHDREPDREVFTPDGAVPAYYNETAEFAASDADFVWPDE